VRVAELWRYPVKSMQGERCQELMLVVGGALGDRAYGVLDQDSGVVLTAKRVPLLLEAAARWGEGGALVHVPGQPELPPGPDLDNRLTDWLGRRVRLVMASTHGTATFENLSDFEDEASEVVSWEGSPLSFVDGSELHLIATADLDQLAEERPATNWDVRRFRPNIVISTGPGLGSTPWLRGTVSLGDALLRVDNGCARCVLTTRSQPGGIERDLDVLRHIARAHNNELGVMASVVRPGPVRQGDVADTSGR
jgi:uncharacterized protein